MSLFFRIDQPQTSSRHQKSGTAVPCFVSTCLEQNAASHAAGKGEILTEELIKDSAAVAYAAGADTSVSTLTTFILAMTLHPEAQKRAQAELDTVVGDRLPTFSDKDDLPFVTAIMKEVFRWIPVLPLAVPHRSVNSDQYKGYFIPAGASVLGNTWYANFRCRRRFSRSSHYFLGLYSTTRLSSHNPINSSPSVSSTIPCLTLQTVVSSALDVGELADPPECLLSH